jgi:hypothetical protein
MSEAKTNTTPSPPNLLLVALVATLVAWLITIALAIIQSAPVSATPIICWWVCWALACIAFSDLGQRQAGGGQ